jgi:hypothetical protein
MKKLKRTPKVPKTAPRLVRGVVGEQSNTTILPDKEVVPFSFDDLPLSIRMQVERIIAYRKAHNLPDDSKERKEQAVKMFKGDKPR